MRYGGVITTGPEMAEGEWRAALVAMLEARNRTLVRSVAAKETNPETGEEFDVIHHMRTSDDPGSV